MNEWCILTFASNNLFLASTLFPPFLWFLADLCGLVPWVLKWNSNKKFKWITVFYSFHLPVLLPRSSRFQKVENISTMFCGTVWHKIGDFKPNLSQTIRLNWIDNSLNQEGPPGWTQEAYRPPCSEYSFCCPNWVPPWQGTPRPDLAGGRGYPTWVPPLTWPGGYPTWVPPAGYPHPDLGDTLPGYPLAGYPHLGTPPAGYSFCCPNWVPPLPGWTWQGTPQVSAPWNSG